MPLTTDRGLRFCLLSLTLKSELVGVTCRCTRPLKAKVCDTRGNTELEWLTAKGKTDGRAWKG